MLRSGERHRFTTRGSEIADAMLAYCGDALHVAPDKISVVSTRRLDDEYWQVRAVLVGHGERVPRDYYLRIRDRNIQVEWEASVGYWSVPPKTYRALGTSEPIVARVRAALGSSYFGPFYEQGRRVQSVDLTTAGQELFYGYVNRHAPEGKELIDILSDGNEHAVTLSLGNVNDETQNVLIHSVLSRTWILRPDKSA